MSILILHIQKVAGIAGSENHLLTLLPRQRQFGFDPSMLVLADSEDRPEDFVARMRRAGVPTDVLHMRGDVSPLLLVRLLRYIRARRFDIVHTHLLHADLYGRIAARFAGCKIVSTYHCDDPFHLIPGVRQMDQLTVRLCAHVICISNAVREFVQEQIWVPSSHLSVVRYGVEPLPVNGDRQGLRLLLSLDPGTVVIGIVARLTAQKGHRYLLQALPEVLKSYPTSHLVIIGDGEERQSLEDLTDSLGIRKQVHFLGYRADAPVLMYDLDVFVLASLFEGFGLVLLEAMVAARPIVATHVSAVPEVIVDGQSGLLVAPQDAGALARAIVRILEDPALAGRLGRLARVRVEHEFTVNRMVEGVAKVYHSLAAAEAS